MTKLSIVRGGEDATRRFERLVRPHYDMLYRVAYRFTGSQQDAEDLVQELCVRAFREIDALAALDSPKTWLLCVLRRLFIDQTRRYDRKNVSSLEAEAHELLEHDAPGPLEQTASALTIECLTRVWRQLSAEQQTLLALHDIEGYSLSEMNEITGIKIGTIKSRLHRARVKLGRLLQRSENVSENELELRARS